MGLQELDTTLVTKQQTTQRPYNLKEAKQNTNPALVMEAQGAGFVN